ncbi:MAG TPA: Hsp20/alpha crystallin family protein [Myxococcota bacterium]|nr:Hsp20/alpha crystallin family protein [Myxococcota bacterium]
MQNTEKALGAWNAGPFASPWRLLDEVFGNAAPARNRGFAPPVDVSETPEEYVVTAELPGTKPEDVTVELNDGILTMRGEKRIERDEHKEHARYVERVFGSFVRSFSLPQNADGEKVAATFKDGVLTLRVPKKEEAKPRTIAIQSH